MPPSEDRSRRRSGAAVSPASVRSGRDADAKALTGRDDELGHLAHALSAARSEQPQVVLIEGPAGIGKTALIRRFAGDHEDVGLVWATGDASERTVPFGVADQLVRRARRCDSPAPVIGADPARYTAVGLAILEALGELQRAGPVVLVVDDAQWSDPGSLRALLFAVRRLVADTVLVILATRASDLHLLPEGFVRIAESSQGVRLKLGPLGFDEVRAMARSRALPLSAHALRRVHELSAGVPLHLCALLDEWAATADFRKVRAPPSYAALIGGRLSQCSDEARRLVESAAVLGHRSSIEDVARVAEVDAPLAALEEAVGRDLIRVANRSIEFVHPLIRSAVHDALGPARLADLHAAAAALVEDPGAALLHRAQAAAAPDGRLAEELEAAAGRTAAGGNWLGAAGFLSEAAELSTTRADRERRILDSVSALCEAGDLDTARSMLPRIRDFGTSAEREFVLGRVALSELDVQTAERHFQAAWTMCPPENPQLAMWTASELALCAYFRVDARSHIDWADRAVQLTSVADTSSAPAVSKLAVAMAMTGRLDDALALVERALCSESAGSRDLALLKVCRGRLRLVNDDLFGARTDLIGVTATTIRRGSSRAAGMALGRLSVVEYFAGRWDLALTHAEQGLAACVDRTDYAQISLLRAPAVLALAARGAWPEADHHLQAMLIESGDVTLPAVYTAFAGAHLAAAKGDAAAVVTALAPVLALSARDAVDEPGFWPWQHVYADALVDLGRLDEAERFLAPHEALARERGRRSMMGRLARSRARLEAARGSDEPAQDAFLRSAEALHEVSMPYELALTELAHGQFLRRRRQRRAAVEVLADARDRFSAVGARPALERCQRELQASGLSPKRPAAKGPGRLTPQEVTVSRLVVAGMTNREIAGELMVSSKTVEVHLTSVYTKLEVTSRTELRARARRGELEILDPQTA